MSRMDDFLMTQLQGANVVPLAMALVNLTGDESVLGRIKPYVKGAWDHLEKVPDELAREIRCQMCQVLSTRQQGGVMDITGQGSMSSDLLQRMMSVSVGEVVDESYVHMLAQHMGLTLATPEDQLEPTEMPPKRKQRLSAIVVGAGASGLCAAIKLQKAGLDVKILEKNDQVGGTWFENVYPGCAVDTPNHFYQYSFEPNNDWPNYFSKRDSIQDYLLKCAQKYYLLEKTYFHHEVLSASYDEEMATWGVTARNVTGESIAFRANFLVFAVGQLNRPMTPEINGLSEFDGQVVHTAQWPRELSVTGKKVALLGTGASAIQVGPAIAEKVKDLYVLQRSGSWISRRPNIDREVSNEKKWVLNNVPFYAAWYRFQLFWAFGDGLFEALKIDRQWQGGAESINPLNAAIRQKMIAYLSSELGDRRDLIEKVTPKYPPFGKRVLGDPGWYQMLRRSNVSLETEPIEAFDRHGVTLKGGKHLALDLLICATGFRAIEMLWPMQVTGANGVNLHQQWSIDGPRAYLGITVPNFPNLFILFGPNTNLGHGGSAIFLAECQMRHVMSAINHVIQTSQSSVMCTQEAHDAYNQSIDSKLSELSWSHPSVSTWYKNAEGRIVTNQPWKLVEYWHLTHGIKVEDYLFS